MTSPAPRALLRYITNGRRVERPLDGDHVRLGRSPEVEIVFSESESGVSRHHATIRRQGAEWVIEDAGSRNGTYLNGRRVQTAPLKDEDRIDLGPFLLTFHVEMPSGTHRETIPGEMYRPDGSASVQFSQYATGSASASINLKAVEDSVDWRAAQVDLEREGTSGSISRDQAWALTLFKEVGQALLVATDLDEMLETVMILVFTHVSAERGVICLVDERGELDPRVVRTDLPGAGPVQFSQSIVNEAVQTQTAVLVKNAVDDDRFHESQSIMRRAVRSAICVPLYHAGRTAGVIYVDTANRREPFTDQQLELLVGLGMFAAIAIAQFELRENAVRERMKRDKLARYHTPAVVDRILEGDVEDAEMLAYKEDVSVLFADIKGFTSMSETLAPTEVVNLLNIVFGRLVDVVFRHRGTLDKFMGDGMLAYFGAPLKLENHAEAAVRAACEMQAAVDELNATGVLPNEIKIRVGINSGSVVVGDVGSPTRRNHTVIGDVVNVASRFESHVCQPGEIIIGSATRELIGELVPCEKLEPVELKGKRHTFTPFRVTGPVAESDSNSLLRKTTA